ERRLRDESMTAELRVAAISKRMWIDERIGAAASGRAPERLNPPPFRGRPHVQWTVHRPEREKGAEDVHARAADCREAALRQRVVRRHEDAHGRSEESLEVRAAFDEPAVEIGRRLKLVAV